AEVCLLALLDVTVRERFVHGSVSGGGIVRESHRRVILSHRKRQSPRANTICPRAGCAGRHTPALSFHPGRARQAASFYGGGGLTGNSSRTPAAPPLPLESPGSGPWPAVSRCR